MGGLDSDANTPIILPINSRATVSSRGVLMALNESEMTKLLTRVDVQSAEESSPVIRLYQKLRAWDLTIVKQYAVERGIYTADEIDRVEDEYRKFLSLVLTYQDVRMPIAKKVDDFWHAHILFTQDYTKMSITMIGRYVHHRPGILDRISVLEKSFHDNTMRLYEFFFGAPEPEIWDSVVCCAQCDGRIDLH